MYRLNLVTAPATEPVTLTEAKAHMRVTTSSDDDYITDLITTARLHAENLTKRAFINQTWQLYLDSFPNGFDEEFFEGYRESSRISLRMIKQGFVTIPRAPLVSISSIKYYDSADSSTTLSSSVYQVAAYAGDTPPCGRVALKSGQSWPGVELRSMDGVEITFVAGYGANASDVPLQIRQAILEIVTQIYENRGDCVEQMPKAALAHLEQYRIKRL